MRETRAKRVAAIHLRHLHPLPNGLENIFARFNRIVVVEMNDEGVYGFGQLATILRARFCEPKIQSVTKTDGLTYRVKEILEGVFNARSVATARLERRDCESARAETTAAATRSRQKFLKRVTALATTPESPAAKH